MRVTALDTSGRPLAGIWLTLTKVDEAASQTFAHGGVTGVDGRYEYLGLTPGTYDVAAPGLPNAQAVRVELSPGRAFESVAFTSSSDAEIRVQVRSRNGEESSGLQVYGFKQVSTEEKANNPAADLPISAEPLGAGAFVFKQLAPEDMNSS